MNFFKLYELPEFTDPRGTLSFCEHDCHLPFIPRRFFWIYGVPEKVKRGEHAHKECEQFLICLNGSVEVLLDNGTNKENIVLSRPNLGLYIPPLTWGVQFNYSPGAILLVLASLNYDKNEYISDYSTFLEARQ